MSMSKVQYLLLHTLTEMQRCHYLQWPPTKHDSHTYCASEII